MTLGLVYFRATDLRYFEAALYSILWQRQLRTHVQDLVVLDNDTETPAEVLYEKLAFARDLLYPATVRLISVKHGDPDKRCHSWSVNTLMRHVRPSPANDWVLFTRSDYLLDRELVQKFSAVVQAKSQGGLVPWAGFVTSYAYHMAYDDRGDQRIEGMRDLEPTRWRTEGAQVLLDRVNGWKVNSSDTDAGVWLTRKSLWDASGGLHERLKAWGFQQTVWQQRLVAQGVEIVQIPEYLFFHQHHGGNFRDYDRAVQELEQHWGPREHLSTFRDVSQFVGRVCDELDTKEPKP